jgi:hypothetical protein
MVAIKTLSRAVLDFRRLMEVGIEAGREVLRSTAERNLVDLAVVVIGSRESLTEDKVGRALYAEL